MDGYEWDPAKAAANLKKHKVDFADAALSLEDPNALTVADPDAGDEERFICLAADPEGRVLVTVYAHRGDRIRSSLPDLRVVASGAGTRNCDAKGVRLL